MRVISCYLENFASYKELDFSFENQGLTLISGPTGSGKSTLCDAISWACFGRTSKDGAVDEVISWNAEGPTKGIIHIETIDGLVTIVRTRGQKANDLYWYEDNREPQMRGKDLNDSQKFINNILGMDINLYLNAGYFHEFSQTAQFFMTTAKNRRAICEQLVDLSLAKTLQTKLTDTKKELTAKGQTYSQKIQSYGERIQYLIKYREFKIKSDNFEQDKDKNIAKLLRDIEVSTANIKLDKYFDEKHAQIVGYKKFIGNETCPTCGNKVHSEEHQKVLELRYELEAEIKENKRNIEIANNLRTQYRKEADSVNIYDELITKMQAESQETTTKLNEYKVLESKNNIQLSDIGTLMDVVNEFRGVTIKNAINQLQDNTNKLLNDYYDAEIRVQFDVADADKLDVGITKDGNQCAYSQLSKGQRQLLKLCFGISVMRQVQNHNATSFNCIFLDEALEGLDENMKTRTFRLLEGLSLNYESVFVVDHSEGLKSMFTNKYTVELVNGNSVINAT